MSKTVERTFASKIAANEVSGVRTLSSAPFVFWPRAIAALSLLRIQSWIYILGIPLLAVLRDGAGSRPSHIVEVFAFSSLALSAGYLFNNYFDLSEDSARKNRFIEMDALTSAKIVVGLHLVLFALACALGLGWECFATVVLNAIYSIPPLRLKRWVWFSLFANGIFFAFIYYAAVKILQGPVAAEDMVLSLLIFFLFTTIQFVHCLEHKDEAGIRYGMGDKIVYALLLGILTSFSWHPIVSEVIDVRAGIKLYSFFCLICVWVDHSGRRARVVVRTASMLLGVYLLAHWSPHLEIK